jgi:hypothetical protein
MIYYNKENTRFMINFMKHKHKIDFINTFLQFQ